ncbi:MAG: succinate dehydrogenase/fumarate reductase iron-sulfur subunit [Myxococcota bacterium]|nr:succinate dehydrogenase/fumarate reductase iron-sulfur subunit [Myxococcota bacterium]
MDYTLHVWRQEPGAPNGQFKTYEAKNISAHASFLEMLDTVNEKLEASGELPIAFDHDCREGICGMCGVMINGEAHGPLPGVTTCQLHMREMEKLGVKEIWIEPWRATAFPIIQDLMVDRSAFDRVLQAGGFISARTGAAPDGNAIPIRKAESDRAMDAATCIGCGACVASCPNASASLFVGAKVTHLGLLPQGQPERFTRVQKMVAQMDEEGFGSCTSHAECEAVCPKKIPLNAIARMNSDYRQGVLKSPVA